MKTKVQVIEIFGTAVVAVVTGTGEEFIPLEPICQSLGLDLMEELECINEDPLLSDHIQSFTVPGEEGQLQEAICINHCRFYGWVLSIDTNRVSEVALPQFLAYQRICFGVLAKHSKRLLGILGINIVADDENDEID